MYKLSPPPLPVAPRRHAAALESQIAIASHYARRAERASQRTKAQKASKSLRGYKEISRKLNSLSQDLCHRNDMRSRESKEVMDSITMLRSQLRDLHKLRERWTAAAPSPDATPMRLSAGDSTEITPLEYIDPETNHNPVNPGYTCPSNHESMGSCLSSHYSDELAAEEYV